MTPQHGKLQELTPNYITDKFIDFITISSLYQDIFLGMDPYTNKALQNLSSVFTCLTDVASGQFVPFFSTSLRVAHSFRSLMVPFIWWWHIFTVFFSILLFINSILELPVTLDFRSYEYQILKLHPLIFPQVQTFGYLQEWEQLILRMHYFYKAFSPHYWWSFLCCYIPPHLIHLVFPTVCLCLSCCFSPGTYGPRIGWRYIQWIL